MKNITASLSGIKPGIKTTELIVAVVYGVSSFLVATGVIGTGLPQSDSGAIQALAAASVGVVSLGYSISRGIAKHNLASPADYLNQLQLAVKAGDPDAIVAARSAVASLIDTHPAVAKDVKAVDNVVKAVDPALAADLDADLGAADPAENVTVVPAAPQGQLPVT